MVSLEGKGNLGPGAQGAVGSEVYYDRTTRDDERACGVPGVTGEEASAGITYASGPDAPAELREGVRTTREDVRDLLRGEWRCGAVQNAHAPDRYMGVDVAFSAPKDLGVVWAGSDSDRRRIFEGCQWDAGRHAFDTVLAPALYARRGHGGVEREPVTVIHTDYPQHLNRASDPGLHTHMLTHSYGLRADGTVGTVEFDNWFGLAHLADADYLLTLSNLLRERAEIELRMNADGKLVVVGVDPRLAEEFSRRTREMIEQYEQAHGKGSWDQATAAEKEAWAVKTRPNHDRAFIEDFLERARAAGLEVKLVAAGRLRSEAGALAPAERDAMLDLHIQDAARVQVHGGYSFASHRDIPGEAWVEDRKILAEAGFRAVGTGATLEDVQAALERAIERGRIVRYAAERTPGGHDAPLSTREQAALEQRAVVDLEALARQRTAAVPEPIVRQEIARWEQAHGAKLAPDQEHAVLIATSGRRVVHIIGPAGGGKTAVHEIIANSSRRVGRDVSAEAPTGKARLELIDGARVNAVTHDTAMARGRHWGPETVAIADEAGFASAVHAASLHADALASGAVLVKSGDPLQLQPVGPGATFRHEIEALQMIDPGAVVVLTEIRRQRDPEVKMIAETAAKGWPGDALVAAYEAGRLSVHTEHRGAVNAAAQDVVRWTARGREAQAIVPSRRDVDLANRTVREALRERGLLPREEITYKAHVDPRAPGRAAAATEHAVTMPDGATMREAGDTGGWSPKARPWEKEIALAVGDRVSVTQNRADLGVQNGSPGRVIGFSPQGDVTVRLDDRWCRVDRSGRPMTDAQTVYDAAGTSRLVEGNEAARYVTVQASEIARPTQDGRYTFVTHDFARTGQRVQGGEAEAVSIAAGLSDQQLRAQWTNSTITRSVSDLQVHLSSRDLRGPSLEGGMAQDPHGHAERQAIHGSVGHDPDRATLRAAEIAERHVERARERLERAQKEATCSRGRLDEKRERAERARGRLALAEERRERTEQRLEQAMSAVHKPRVGGEDRDNTATGQRAASRVERAEQAVHRTGERVERARQHAAHTAAVVEKAERQVAQAEAQVTKADERLEQFEERLARIERRLERARERRSEQARSRGNGEARGRSATERDVVWRAADRANEMAFGRTTLDFTRGGLGRGMTPGYAPEQRRGRAGERESERLDHALAPGPLRQDRGYQQEQDRGMAR